MNPRGRSLETSSKTVSGSDRAFANLLHLFNLYIREGKCPDCEQRVAEALCGQLALIAHSNKVSPVLREGCLELLDHWLPTQVAVQHGSHVQGPAA
jgi:hypothetical protein